MDSKATVENDKSNKEFSPSIVGASFLVSSHRPAVVAGMKGIEKRGDFSEKGAPCVEEDGWLVMIAEQAFPAVQILAASLCDSVTVVFLFERQSRQVQKYALARLETMSPGWKRQIFI